MKRMLALGCLVVIGSAILASCSSDRYVVKTPVPPPPPRTNLADR